MKKIFTFFAAALLSVTAIQATILTQNVAWSPFTEEGSKWTTTETGYKITLNQWSSCSEMWSWVEGASDYEQLVIEVAEHAGDIHVFAKFCEGSETSDLVSSAVLHAGTNSIGLDVKAGILHSLQVRNFSNSDNVDITITGLYFRKATGTPTPVSLWEVEGGMYFDTFKDWDDQIILDGSKFKDVKEGDFLEINYTLDANSYHLFKIQSSWKAYFPAFLGGLDAYSQYNISTDINPTQIRFTILDATDIDYLKNQGGLHINAIYLTINSINLITHDDKATAIDNTTVDTKAVKFVRDGQLYILRDGKTYTMQGQIVQ